MSGQLTECAEHEWHFEPGDWCPVCQGIELEKERITQIIRQKITPKETADLIIQAIEENK